MYKEYFLRKGIVTWGFEVNYVIFTKKEKKTLKHTN